MFKNNGEMTRDYELRYINLQINKAADRLKELEYVWNEDRTLKLYDVFYECDEICEKIAKENHYIYDGNADDEFNFFCESTYDMFIDDCMQMYGADFHEEATFTGRTSHFYLTDLCCYDYGIEGIIEKHIGYGIEIRYRDGKFYLSNYSYPDDYWKDYEDIVSVVDSYLHHAKQIADYIDSFKEHQIENFEEFMYYQIVENEIYEKSTTHPDKIAEAKYEYHSWRRENMEVARITANKIFNTTYHISEVYFKCYELLVKDFQANFGGDSEAITSMFLG